MQGNAIHKEFDTMNYYSEWAGGVNGAKKLKIFLMTEFKAGGKGEHVGNKSGFERGVDGFQNYEKLIKCVGRA